MIYPDWMDNAGLMAKSKELGGDTLVQHTWAVLQRLADQVRLRPRLPHLLGERVWEQLFWGCLLHDFGKAAVQFQERLTSKDIVNDWSTEHHRHEILSLAFVDWLFPKDHPDRPFVIAVIVCHHKDSDAIFFHYGGEQPYSPERPEEKEATEFLSHQIDTATRGHLWRWLAECSAGWAEALGIPLIYVQPALISQEKALAADLGKAIRLALRDFANWRKALHGRDRALAMLYRGVILTADHAASAGAPEFPPMPLDQAIAHQPMAGKSWRDHQQWAAEAPTASAILIAPTGSGKTEAALLWAARQIECQPAARLFYTLPYQASMNAMSERLLRDYFSEGQPLAITDSANRYVMIQHSRALLKLYRDSMEADSSPRAARDLAKALKNQTRLNYYPIQVFSPYQMLKAAYSLKGYEALLVDYTDALFIFDEIHAYEPARLALIIEMIRWLRENFSARFLVMTATLPPMILHALADALGNPVIQTASDQDFERSRRHTVHLLDGNLADDLLPYLEADLAAGKAVLVCCNRIADAQAVYRHLQAALDLDPQQGEIVLLHGRFNGEDRGTYEEVILDTVRAKVRPHPLNRRFITVATQVVEVSIDVDFDTLYTDPAPLEALLQRFGRVNRGRQERGLCPVHIFQEPSNTTALPDPYLPYDPAIVTQSLAVLEQYCSEKTIDEAQVTTMLAEIYTREIETVWQTAYSRAAREFREAILRAMQPYQSAEPEIARQFYKLFDGVQVLPVDCENAYLTAVEEEGYLAASRYLVNISWRNYHEFNSYTWQGHPCIIKSEDDYTARINVPYDPEFGLDLDEVRRANRQGHEGDE